MDQPSDAVVGRGGTVVRRLRADEVAEVLQRLDAAEAAAGAPLVDESERERLRAASGDEPLWEQEWTPLGAFHGASLVGYAGQVATTAPDAEGGAAGAPGARGDAATFRSDPLREVRSATLAASRAVAADAGRSVLEVWVRQGGDQDVEVASREGFEVARRLGVLGRHLDELGAPVEPIDHHVRVYRPDEDDDEVVAVLAAAYEDTPEAGWDRARFRERRGYDWFRPEDLLVAVDDRKGHIAGLHWLKRRDASTGEVYNLAVHPDAQGKRLGPALLDAGLRHLREVGCTEVVLWVDRGNERAVALYEGQGFTTRWDDLAFRATLP